MTLVTLQVETMKKAHHTACKEEKLATSRENTGKMENNAEAQKKLQDKVEKSQQETEKVRRPPCSCDITGTDGSYRWLHQCPLRSKVIPASVF